ncbi:lipase, partial [Nocardia africana]
MKQSYRRSCLSAAIIAGAAMLTLGLPGAGAGADPAMAAGDQQQEQRLAEMITHGLKDPSAHAIADSGSSG